MTTSFGTPGTAPVGQQSLCERGLGLADDRFERRRLGDGEVRKHLAVDRNAGLVQARDKFAVVQPERPYRRIEPLNPQRAERALAALAAAVIALGGLEHLLVLGMGGDAALDACHGRSPVE